MVGRAVRTAAKAKVESAKECMLVAADFGRWNLRMPNLVRAVGESAELECQ